jgi:hypothetical protein
MSGVHHSISTFRTVNVASSAQTDVRVLSLSIDLSSQSGARRWLAHEADAGRVRHAVIGGRKEKFFRKEWLDEHIESMTVPVPVGINVRKRA